MLNNLGLQERKQEGKDQKDQSKDAIFVFCLTKPELEWPET